MSIPLSRSSHHSRASLSSPDVPDSCCCNLCINRKCSLGSMHSIYPSVQQGFQCACQRCVPGACCWCRLSPRFQRGHEVSSTDYTHLNARRSWLSYGYSVVPWPTFKMTLEMSCNSIQFPFTNTNYDFDNKMILITFCSSDYLVLCHVYSTVFTSLRVVYATHFFHETFCTYRS